MENYRDELYHHGIMGMKWGVWNEETRRKRMGGGRGERFKLQRGLNKLDKQRARQEAKYLRNRVASSKTQNPKKIAKLNQEGDEIKRARKGIDSEINRKKKEASKKGYTVTSKDRLRDGRSFAEKALLGSLSYDTTL